MAAEVVCWEQVHEEMAGNRVGLLAVVLLEVFVEGWVAAVVAWVALLAVEGVQGVVEVPMAVAS